MNDYTVLLEQRQRLAQAERDRMAADLRQHARAERERRIRIVALTLLTRPIQFMLNIRLPQPTYTAISPCETCPSQAPL